MLVRELFLQAAEGDAAIYSLPTPMTNTRRDILPKSIIVITLGGRARCTSTAGVCRYRVWLGQLHLQLMPYATNGAPYSTYLRARTLDTVYSYLAVCASALVRGLIKPGS